MMGEKILNMGLAMVVSILVARHLGPEDYGIYSYAISFVTLFTIATHVGLNGLAVRELVNFPNNQEEVLGTILGLKLIGTVVAVIFFLVFLFNAHPIYDVEFWVLLLVAGTILLKPFEIFDYWFQANVKAKYSSIVRATAVVVVSILKIVLVIVGARVLAFAGAYLFQNLFVVLLFTIVFKRVTKSSFKKWSFSTDKAKELFGQSWMIMLGSLFATIYMKIDQVMIRWIVSAEEVGIYSVAARISESWYFIPSVIVASLFPKLISLREKNKEEFVRRLQQLFDFLFLMALIVAIIITTISDTLINVLYGSEYEKAALILSIHIWAGLFVFMRAAFSKWMLVEDAIAFSMITQGLGAITNILLNLVLIPPYGGFGAAVATIISYAMASYLSLLFYKKSRPVFWMMSKSLLSPFRYLNKYIST